MKKTALIAVSATAALLAAACGSSDAAEPDLDAPPKTTPIYEIEVPGDAVEKGEPSPARAFYDLPGWDFDDASEWMGERLSQRQEIDGMELRDAARLASSHQWCWDDGGDDDEIRMLLVDVGAGGGPNDAPTSITIVSDTDDMGC